MWIKATKEHSPQFLITLKKTTMKEKEKWMKCIIK